MVALARPAYPYAPRIVPAGLVNGRLTPEQTTYVTMPGVGAQRLHTVAARAWFWLALACKNETGHNLSSTGAYRPLAAQEAVWNARMIPWRYTDGRPYRGPDGKSAPVTYDPRLHASNGGGKPYTRTYRGIVWLLHRGLFPVAVPGTSNHGWGIAVDSAWFVPGRGLLYITTLADGWAWLVREAPSYGFGWEGARPGVTGYEPHHLRHLHGDDVSPRVKAIESFLGGIK